MLPTCVAQTLFSPPVDNWNSTLDFGNVPFSSGAMSVGEVHADERPVTDTSTNSVTNALTCFLPHVDNTTATTGNMAPSPVDELNTQSDKNTDSTAAENPPTNKDFSSISFQPTSHAQQNPLLPTQAVHTRPPKRQLDPAQACTMNEAKAAKQAMAMLVKQNVVRLIEDYEENIANLAKKHSVRIEYMKHLITTASNLKRKRAPGRIQALVHIKAQEVNASLPVGSKLKAPELRKLVEQDDELVNMSDEKLQIAKRGVDKKRMLSTRGARPNIASAPKDYSATSQRMQTEFDSLHLRTGAVGFGVLAPASSDDRGRPIWFVAGNNSVDFVRKNLNTTMWDLLGNLELWASTRNSQKPATIPDLQSQCSAIIASGLHGEDELQQLPASYRRKIPHLPHRPSQSSNLQIHQWAYQALATLKALHAVLESGDCLWARMSQDDIAKHSKWMKTQVVKERSAQSDKGWKHGP
ncbi:hypothetical protein BDP27DRAFT_1434558 [Rhodocollybia butyracea]|uniref:Uncharacterized protein n=1 Tax=Rhodocollybia butyracea TaxID=206335 RepID=A0A9P5P3F0_9AGAR|nr:hypothetical protein BDP27DRAFT_1434558 [Rhodocollybia butyracea]